MPRLSILPPVNGGEGHVQERGKLLLRQAKVLAHLFNDDDDFRMATLPTTTKGTAKVAPGNGVKINYVYYWCDAFRNPEVEKTQVPVRYDPYDVATAYAYVGGRWVRCDSEYAPRLRGHSEREIGLATEELRKQSDDDRGCIPAASVQAIAPSGGNFSHKDYYTRALEALNEPLVNRKVDAWRQALAELALADPPPSESAAGTQMPDPEA